jgi:hypothetical protein
MEPSEAVALDLLKPHAEAHTLSLPPSLSAHLSLMVVRRAGQQEALALFRKALEADLATEGRGPSDVLLAAAALVVVRLVRDKATLPQPVRALSHTLMHTHTHTHTHTLTHTRCAWVVGAGEPELRGDAGLRRAAAWRGTRVPSPLSLPLHCSASRSGGPPSDSYTP